MHTETFHQKYSALPHVFRMTSLHHHNGDAQKSTWKSGSFQIALGHNTEDTKPPRKEHLQAGTDGNGGMPAKKYKTTKVVAEKLGRESKNGKVTP